MSGHLMDYHNGTEWLERNATIATIVGQGYDGKDVLRVIVIRIIYGVGILGNLAAIVTLCKGDKKIKNRKHALMLKCLAVNDLVALVGMLVLMSVQSVYPTVVPRTQWFCALRVVLRIFGLGSVCIAIVMALERWLALTQPFLYQKHVTYYVVRKALLVLWGCAALLTCLPFLGFGIYYDHEAEHIVRTDTRCVRYRDATDPIGVAYAYVYLTFGTLLCICLVWCNLAVIRVLCRSNIKGSDQRLLVRRISRTSNKSKPLAASNLNDPIVYNAATADEIAFSKLMATLSVCFIICWMPQMVSTLLALLNPPKERPHLHTIIFRVSDILMLLNYALDPYIYVLLRGNNKPFPKCIKTIFRSRIFGKQCKNQNSLKLTSQHDGLTALTTIEITPPATALNSPPWPKRSQDANHSDFSSILPQEDKVFIDEIPNDNTVALTKNSSPPNDISIAFKDINVVNNLNSSAV